MRDRRRGNQPTGVEALKEISERLGGLFDRVRDAVADAEEGAGAVDEVVEFGDKSGVHGVAGFRMRVGAGEGGVRASASTKPTAREPGAAAAAPLEFEVHDGGETLIVTARLDGFEEPSAAVEVSPMRLVATIDATPHTVDLPAPVKTEGWGLGVRNGILEVTLRKANVDGTDQRGAEIDPEDNAGDAQ